MVRHIRETHRQGPTALTCTDCAKQFIHRSSLVKHRRFCCPAVRASGDFVGDEWFCEACGASFAQKSSGIRHLMKTCPFREVERRDSGEVVSEEGNGVGCQSL